MNDLFITKKKYFQALIINAKEKMNSSIEEIKIGKVVTLLKIEFLEEFEKSLGTFVAPELTLSEKNFNIDVAKKRFMQPFVVFREDIV